MMVRACGYRPAPWIEPIWVWERLNITPHSLIRKARTMKPNDKAASAMMHGDEETGLILHSLGGWGRRREK